MTEAASHALGDCDGAVAVTGHSGGERECLSGQVADRQGGTGSRAFEVDLAAAGIDQAGQGRRDLVQGLDLHAVVGIADDHRVGSPIQGDRPMVTGHRQA